MIANQTLNRHSNFKIIVYDVSLSNKNEKLS
jgi:hypothetical protein